MITLVVIGVVAAITMPMIVADWQKNATVERLKKAYSTLSNAVALSVADNGLGYNWDVPNEKTYQVNKKFAETYLTPYLNVGQVCEYGKDDVCNYQITAKMQGQKMTGNFYASNRYYEFALADGATIYTDIDWADNQNASFKVNLGIDINGPAKPNKMGRDIFAFIILSETDGVTRVLPYTYSVGSRTEHMNYCKMVPAYCSGVIMADGWQIKDDYPW